MTIYAPFSVLGKEFRADLSVPNLHVLRPWLRLLGTDSVYTQPNIGDASLIAPDAMRELLGVEANSGWIVQRCERLRFTFYMCPMRRVLE